MKLYSYWRSGAAYRVRIALNLKGIDYELETVNLLPGPDGVPPNRAPSYRALNPQMRVPALMLDDGTVLTQSPAILEWIEETYPVPPLLPTDPLMRAKVRAVLATIACDIHPLTNVGPLNWIRKTAPDRAEALTTEWIQHWNAESLPAIEAMISPGPFAFGTEPTLADVAIVPQIYSARRFQVPLNAYPKLVAVDAAMQELDAVKRAAPGVQPDAR